MWQLVMAMAWWPVGMDDVGGPAVTVAVRRAMMLMVVGGVALVEVGGPVRGAVMVTVGAVVGVPLMVGRSMRARVGG